MEALRKFKEKSDQVVREAGERAQVEQAEKDAKAVEIASAPIRLDDLRNEITLMRYPFFSTDHTKRTEPIIYQNGEKYHEVRPAVGLGMATERDADILRYVIKKMVFSQDKSGGMTGGVNVTRRELLTHVFGGADGTANYKDLEAKLKRLTMTSYNTNVFSTDPNEFFAGSLASCTYWKDERDGVEKICLKPCEPLLKNVQEYKVKLVEIGFLEEKGNLKKKLLDIVSVHIGSGEKPWPISLKQLAIQCAFTKEPKRFKEAIKRAKLPYKLAFHKDKQGNQIITFSKL